MSESLPTDYFKRSLRLLSNPGITAEQIDMVCESDPGFNRYFLEEQPKRREMMQKLMQ